MQTLEKKLIYLWIQWQTEYHIKTLGKGNQWLAFFVPIIVSQLQRIAHIDSKTFFGSN